MKSIKIIRTYFDTYTISPPSSFLLVRRDQQQLPLPSSIIHTSYCLLFPFFSLPFSSCLWCCHHLSFSLTSFIFFLLIVLSSFCASYHLSHHRMSFPLRSLSTETDQLSRCPHCGKLFRGPRSSASLDEHITNIHAVVAPTASLSAQSRSLVDSLGHPLSVTTGVDGSFSCFKCKASFSHSDLLEKHQLVCHSIIPLGSLGQVSIDSVYLCISLCGYRNREDRKTSRGSVFSLHMYFPLPCWVRFSALNPVCLSSASVCVGVFWIIHDCTHLLTHIVVWVHFHWLRLLYSPFTRFHHVFVSGSILDFLLSRQFQQ